VASELEIGPESAGERLDVLLAQALGSRSRAQRQILAGRVLVDGATVRKNHRVTAGELITVDDSPEASIAPDPDAPVAAFAVAYEDEHLIVVDKPAGVVVHPAPGHSAGTLAHALLERGAAGGDAWRPGIVHRLDRDTSGLMVVARSEEAHRRLQSLVRRRELDRRYLTLVVGRPRSRRGRIEAPIGRDRRDPLRRSLDTDSPREAITHFELVELLPRHALLDVRLETGRTHQIRVHLAAIDLPVAGDPVYGRPDEVALGRQFLHARRLAFPHPFTDDPVETESPLPSDLTTALERARAV